LFTERTDFLAAALEAAAQPILVVDPDGLIRFANPAAIVALGYESADELFGRRSHETIHCRRPDGTPYPATDCPVLTRATGKTVARDLDRVEPSSQRVAAAFSRMQERDGLRSHAGGRSRLVPCERLRRRGGDYRIHAESRNGPWRCAGALDNTKRSTAHAFARGDASVTPRSRRISGVTSLDRSDRARSGFSRNCLRELIPIVALGATALRVFAWCPSGIRLLASEFVAGAVAAGAFR